MPCHEVTEPTLIGEVEGTRKGGFDQLGNRKYTLVFEVQAPREYGLQQVLAVLPFVRGDRYEIGEVSDPWHEVDYGAFCLTRDAQQQGDGTKWLCTVEFGLPDISTLGGDTAFLFFENPALAPAGISWDGEDYEEIVDRDVNGVAILNKAKDRPNPALTRPRTRRTLVVEQHYLYTDWDDTVIDLVQDHVNANVFYGRAVGTWLCRKITAQLVYHQAGMLVRVRMEFHHREEGWHSQPLNDGTRQLVYSEAHPAGEYKPILVGGQPVTDPKPLDAVGTALAVGADPIFLDFEIIPSADFDVLDIRFP
jgi:hypothetical protein